MITSAAAGLSSLQDAARRRLGVTLSRRQLEAFAAYAAELVAWNERANLTAITDPAGIEVKHFLDSLTVVPHLGRTPTGKLVDVGSGAGFPGLPIKIACPALSVTLIEATGKKADFCRHIVEHLGLEGVQVVHARAEEAGRDEAHRQQYDVAVARAVAALPVLVEYLLPLVRRGGKAIAQKGESGPSEAHQAEMAIRVLGGQLRQVAPVELPGVAEARYLIVIDKTAATPPAYPRRAGLPTRRPLR
ncbi:MAG TPA: 16S rRNA (guanine(527)-N(7))-methyltransferase RsmG [Anaerolineales bacterium]|nr:16S rRNA (guanine(527)-N(7))-methyltransferase RsmG [Anaerolineales bacterium]